MIFMYNNTNQKLQLKSTTVNGECTLKLNIGETDGISIISAKDERIVAAMEKKYATEKDVTYNPSREYVLVKDTRILIKPSDDTTETAEYVISETETNQRPQDLIKNMLVLVLDADDRYVVNFSDCKNKVKVEKAGEYTVVIMCLKAYNWSNLSREINMYITNGNKNTKRIQCTSNEVEAKDKSTYKQNVVLVTDYDGEVPVFKKKTDKDHHGAGGYKNNYNKNDRGGYGNKNSFGSGSRLVIPKYEDNSSRSQGNRKKSGKFNNKNKGRR